MLQLSIPYQLSRNLPIAHFAMQNSFCRAYHHIHSMPIALPPRENIFYSPSPSDFLTYCNVFLHSQLESFQFLASFFWYPLVQKGIIESPHLRSYYKKEEFVGGQLRDFQVKKTLEISSRSSAAPSDQYMMMGLFQINTKLVSQSDHLLMD